MKNKNIDKKLKEWDANIALSRDKDDQIKKSIMDNLDKPVSHSGYQFEDPYFHIHKKVIYFAGVAASLCFALLVGTKFNSNNVIDKPQITASVDNSAKFAQLTPEEIKDLRKIAAELHHTFPEGIRMISQENNGNLQIDTDEKKGLDDKDQVLLRYVVMKKDASGNGWKQVYVSNVIAPAGEPIELKGKNSGHIWIYPAGGNVYAVESDLKIQANGESINLEYAGGQELRTPQNIKTIINADSEYKVYQTLMKI